MPTTLPLPSGATAEFVTPEELTYRQEEALTTAGEKLMQLRVAAARARGEDPDTLPDQPRRSEMAEVPTSGFEIDVAGVLCLSWTHDVRPPGKLASDERWKEQVSRHDVRAVLNEALRLLPAMDVRGSDTGAPFDESNTSPTTSPPTPPPPWTPPTPEPSPSGGS